MEIERLRGVATIITFPLVDADGDTVTGATSPDSEIDTWNDGTAPNGFTDCTNEATEIGTTGQYYLSLTAAEMDADYIIVQCKSSAKTQTILIRTKQIGIIRAGLAQSATASTIVLDAAAALGDDNPNGSLVYIVAGTGAGQSPRVITDYVTATDTATVSPDWTTTPDSTSVFVLVGSPPAPTAIAGLPAVNVTHWLGTAAATPTVAGVPEVDVTHNAGTAITAASGIQEVKVASIAANAITATAIQDDAITAAKIAANAIGASELAADAVTEIVAGVFARTYEATKMSGVTFEELTALCACALLAKVSGLDTTTGTFRNVGDSANAIVATVDADGNRSAITLTLASVR